MTNDYVLALDQGTTSSRALLFDREGSVISSAAREFKQYYPQPAWVEHDAEEIWDTQFAVAQEAIEKAKAKPEQIRALGITNQRETVVLWDRATSKPVFHAIVWQCRRTADECSRIRREGYDAVLREKTGLVVDAYFSATKIAWLLENVPGARRLAEDGRLCCGTIDSWLIWKLTEGRRHVTDVSNASRTMLFNLQNLAWDEEILRYFKIPASLLAEVRPSSGILGETTLFGGRHPIAGVAGDQQASLFGHGCHTPGSVKNTYGTGCFLLMNTGREISRSQNGLVSTAAWQRDGVATYALEGSVFVAGAAVQWLRDELKIIQKAGETEAMALSIPDTAGVYFVPAFVGLGAPYWDAYARGTLTGLTRGAGRNHIARAALESMAYQTRDVLDCMIADSGRKPDVLRVDGGAAQNNFLCQFQADILGVAVERAPVAETTALGAACLAGLGAGWWKNEEEMRVMLAPSPSRKGDAKRFEPKMDSSRSEELYDGWLRAVERAKGWIQH
ncbi:MAG: glycerol kinase GlpK [Acidobacteriota bacterium]|nr:glycerol kinase GlpK [Acidobacteriota bacterium]